MMKLTVICRESGRESDILIYTVDVANPDNSDEVRDAVQMERDRDLGDDSEGEPIANEMEILFAFQGDLSPRADWRE